MQLAMEPIDQLAGDKLKPALSGVPETMLWALHNRAAEASRPDAILVDPDSIRIYQSIDYDFHGQFGDPAGSLAVRSAAIDHVLRAWLLQHPHGCIVSLGEGLETQARRVDNGTMRWLSVDLPGAIQVRQRFLPPTDRFRHLACSALDPAWMDEVDATHGVFIIAQGLLMYLQPNQVRRLLAAIPARFPTADLVFDLIPRWFSRLTLQGWQQTRQYRLPPMPFGIDRDEIESTLLLWHPDFAHLRFLDYISPRGLPFLAAQMIGHLPTFRHQLPPLVHHPARLRLATDETEPQLSGNENSMPQTEQTETMAEFVAGANRTIRHGSSLAIASGQVIAKRVALGFAAAANPLEADHAEFARMVPEKVAALQSARAILLEHAAAADTRLRRLATIEMMTALGAAMALGTCTDPAALAAAQTRFAFGCLDRAAANFVAMGMLALQGHDAVMAPFHQTVAANTKRLAAEKTPASNGA